MKEKIEFILKKYTDGKPEVSYFTKKIWIAKKWNSDGKTEVLGVKPSYFT